MRRRLISKLPALALLTGLFVVLVPAAPAGLGSVRSHIASAHADGLVHADAVLVSWTQDAVAPYSPVRRSMPSTRLVTSVVGGIPTLRMPVVTGLVVMAAALLLMFRRRRAPPDFSLV